MFDKFLKNDQGESIADKMVSLAIGAILFGAVVIVGINLVVDTTLNASSTVKTIVQTVVPIIIGVAGLLLFLNLARVRGK